MGIHFDDCISDIEADLFVYAETVISFSLCKKVKLKVKLYVFPYQFEDDNSNTTYVI